MGSCRKRGWITSFFVYFIIISYHLYTLIYKMETFYTIKEVAENLKVSKITIYRYIKKWTLIAVKVWKQFRVSQKNLDKFISDNQTDNG